MKDYQRHLPFALILYSVVALAATGARAGVDGRVLITLLAPGLWLGLYLLGSDANAARRG